MDSDTLISTGVGSLIGSAVALIATYFSHKWQTDEQKQKEAQIVKGVLQGIHDEIETLWEAYMDGAGSHIDTLPNGALLPVIGLSDKTTSRFTL